jgi:hypothetical protein
VDAQTGWLKYPSVYDLEGGTELFLDYGEDFFQEIYNHGRDKPPPQD